ncbi:hypothetical protein FISHEDRAFT_7828, partial [Fistulina hepatica ATCC 64428]
MATLPSRRPLTERPRVPSNARSVSFKRPRSPEPVAASIKRARSNTISFAAVAREKPAKDAERERRHQEREQQRLEFKEKYTRAFPRWTFYFDPDCPEADYERLSHMVSHLGASVEDFFSKQITHVITNKPVPFASTDVDLPLDKENKPRSRRSTTVLRSPIKLAGATELDLVSKAIEFGQKVWSATKLQSVLERCLDQPRGSATTSTRQERDLSTLLKAEKIHGTSERDPTSKRHDFHYFSRGSHFILLEDMQGELATIIAHEYPRQKEGEKAPWPVLYCHPHSRNPFIEFDEKEERRYRKTQKQERVDEDAREFETERILRAREFVRQRAEASLHVTRVVGDLRRTVSLNNLRRREEEQEQAQEQYVDLDADDSANASGYLVSGAGPVYIAASGNSVGITSTTGTTSMGLVVRHSLQLPPSLRGRIDQQVVMSKKAGKELAKQGDMGPPPDIPNRRPILRKSKSTNTIRLGKRDEGAKPGYCESCRVKFADFNQHIYGKRHARFVQNEHNYLQLDSLLARVRRRTLLEVQAEEAAERV